MLRPLARRLQIVCFATTLASGAFTLRVHAQVLTPTVTSPTPPSGTSNPTPAVVPSAPEAASASAPEAIAPSAPEPAASSATSSATPTTAVPVAPSAAPATQPSTNVSASSLPSRADAWVAFEQQRDVQTARGEKVFFPLSLALQAGLGVGLAAVSHAPTGSRIALGVAGGLAAAALLPTMLTSSRDTSRAWFGIGSAAFSLGLGASLIALDLESRHNEGGSRHANGRFIGSAIALQGLVMLPIGLMAGFPSATDYEMYWKLPQEARPDAAARILRQIDRYEQRTTAFVLFGALAAAVVLSAGVISVHNSDERKQLAAVSFIPLGTSLIAVLPRLFAGSRMEHYAVGDAPRRMAFNAW